MWHLLLFFLFFLDNTSEVHKGLLIGCPETFQCTCLTIFVLQKTITFAWLPKTMQILGYCHWSFSLHGTMVGVVPSCAAKGITGSCREMYAAYLLLLPLSSTFLQGILAVAGTLTCCKR